MTQKETCETIQEIDKILETEQKKNSKPKGGKMPELARARLLLDTVRQEVEVGGFWQELIENKLRGL